MTTIKVAVIGVGNCASSLVQGKYHYAGSNTAHGLIHEDIAGYKVSDIDFVAAFDVDSRKVGLDLGEAIFAKTQLHQGVPRRCAEDRHGRADGAPSSMASRRTC